MSSGSGTAKKIKWLKTKKTNIEIAQRLAREILGSTEPEEFLDVMHPELRHASEPNADKDNFDWRKIAETAGKNGDALLLVGKYGRQGKGAESYAIRPHQPRNRPNRKKQSNLQQSKQNPKYPPRCGNDQLYQQRKNSLC